MPRDRHRRTRCSRALIPLALGFVALMTIGSVGTGSDLVAGAVDQASNTTTGGVGATTTATASIGRSASTPDVPDARAAIAGGAPPLSGLVGYRWPLLRGRLTQPFGPTTTASRVYGGEPFHDGIDLATFCGDRIVAAHDGVVLAANRHFDEAIGWLGDLTAYYKRLDSKKLWNTLPIVVVTDDGNGFRSMYAHFEKVVVKRGQFVRAGELLGYEGATGHASGCHLHYGLFSPFERGEILIDRGVAKRMKLPRAEIARVDPMVILPPRPKPVPKPTPTMGLPASAPTGN